MHDKYGFVYIWYDRKRSMYYIGSHWGTEEDGYICSSNRMRKAYRRRPEDFKRRVLSRIYSDRLSLLDEEQRWFDMVKNKDRYYNLNFNVKYAWWSDPDQKLTIGEKISKAMNQPETKAKLAAGRAGKNHSDATKQKISEIQTGKPKSEEHRRKIGEASAQRKHSDESKSKMSVLKQNISQETRDKISKAHKGKTISADQKSKLLQANLGKTHSQETKEKMSLAQTGKILTEDHKAKIAASRRKSFVFFSPSEKMHIVDNLKEFCDLHALQRTAMTQVANGKRVHHKGWTSQIKF